MSKVQVLKKSRVSEHFCCPLYLVIFPTAVFSICYRYADAVLADTEGFQEKLTKEINDLIEKHFDDESVPEVSPSVVFNTVPIKHKSQMNIVLITKLD